MVWHDVVLDLFGCSSVIVTLRLLLEQYIFNSKHVAINLVYEQFNNDCQRLFCIYTLNCRHSFIACI